MPKEMTFALLSTSELACYVDNGVPLSDELRQVDDVVVDGEGGVVTLVARRARRPARRTLVWRAS